jgi:hypothetical protein
VPLGFLHRRFITSWNAATETLFFPSSFDGRGAATTDGDKAGSSGGLWGGGLRGGYAGWEGSSATA